MKKNVTITFLLMFLIVSVTILSCTNVNSDSENDEPDIKNYNFHSTIEYLPEGTDGSAGKSATYVLFGDWPQTIKSDAVTIDETKSMKRGDFTYFKGSDSNWYVKCIENGYENGTTCYSDGSLVSPASEKSTKYFKVEPIKWRVLTDSFDHDGKSSTPGKKLLFSEYLLEVKVFSYFDRDKSKGTVLGETVIHRNNYKYSNVRAYLNSINNQFNIDGGTPADLCPDWTEAGFLQSAFDSSSQVLIADTLVDNSELSTMPNNEPIWGNSGGKNEFACDDTLDKVFLLSFKEITTSDYGFNSYEKADDPVRVLPCSDYYKALTGRGKSIIQLRSPYWYCQYGVWCDLLTIGEEGHTLIASGGLAPALCIN